eukprot:TRINITY_DN26015_c0_g1_i1.p1 TRINITY_DN26015_c0_g1~~TRINITY_DN26015_c0_g1_i1.p1  ORF type:complete len:320 (+),score=43.10 TRINITY_DN26015_c0_g1_i1:61-1020(+)
MESIHFPEAIRQHMPEQGRRIVDVIENKPTPVRVAYYVGPIGYFMLLVSAFIASRNGVCQDECIRVGEALEDKLLECADRCLVKIQDDATQAKTCEKKCASSIGYTKRQVNRKQSDCIDGCDHSPWTLYSAAFLAVICMLPVVPLLGAYRDACSCECCKGSGCSPKTALYSVAWVSYGWSLLWAIPTVAEDRADVGAKALFAITQGIAATAMSSSRKFAEDAEAKENDNAYRMSNVAGGMPPPGGSQRMSDIVGAPIGATNPIVQELQSQCNELEGKVRRLEEQVRTISQRQDQMTDNQGQSRPSQSQDLISQSTPELL